MEHHLLSPKRVRKNITISETTVEYLQEYSQMHGLNFSRTIEGLALMSIRDTRMLGVLALLQQTIRSEVAHQYNRMAKLTVHAGLEAGQAKEFAKSIYWWVIMQADGDYMTSLQPNETPVFEGLQDQFRVDLKTADGQRQATMLKKRAHQNRYKAVKSLRSAIEELQDIMADMEKWADEYIDEDARLEGESEPTTSIEPNAQSQ